MGSEKDDREISLGEDPLRRLGALYAFSQVDVHQHKADRRIALHDSKGFFTGAG